MIDRAFLARIRIEPLDRATHDRTAFTCGVARVDNFIQKTAARQQDSDLTRVSVACLDDANSVVGFYALNAHAIDASSLPPDVHRSLPRYDRIASIYLSVLGVDKSAQGHGVGSLLMADAFATAAKVANLIGAHFLVLDALDERAAELYRKLNFVDLPGHAPRMLINMAQVRAAVAMTPKSA